jgi:type II secretory pathway pseudopilin PulG
MRSVIRKKGQVWVETVIYTLIGLTIMGLVLAVALPKINQKKDEVLIDQAIKAMGNIDDRIYEVQRATGNVRSPNIDIGKGRVIIDLDEDSISWVIDSKFKYSEPGFPTEVGTNMIILTEETDPWTVTVKIIYGVDLRFDELSTGTKELDSAPTPYKLRIENAGKSSTGNLIIKLSVS